jgi:hypothetical protein
MPYRVAWLKMSAESILHERSKLARRNSRDTCIEFFNNSAAQYLKASILPIEMLEIAGNAAFRRDALSIFGGEPSH